MPLRKGFRARLETASNSFNMQRGTEENKIKREEAEEKSTDSVLASEIKARFVQNPEEQYSILLGVVKQDYDKNPVFLRPELLEDLVCMAPKTAIVFAKEQYNAAPSVKASKDAEKIMRIVFKLMPEQINQENFDFLVQSSNNRLVRIEREADLLEELCFSYPELANANPYFKDFDLSVELKTQVDEKRERMIRIFEKNKGIFMYPELFPEIKKRPYNGPQ